VIPIELELENFLAYRQTEPLRFEGIHIACLAGPNGAGKSSLLEAITWSLWGKARSNSPDDLIHQGQTEMRVALTFDQEGGKYKVIRQRKAGKRGASLLELLMWDPGTESWRGISEGGMRATQDKIEKLLHLDYDTFVNSAFLLQGRADEFTTKTPSERKQVLANILGLSVWEVYEDRAKTHLAANRNDILRLDGRLEEIERELAQRERHQAELAESQEAADAADARLAETERKWADIEQTRNELVTFQKQVDDLTRRITALDRDIAEATREREQALVQADKAAIQAAVETVRADVKAMEPLQVRLSEATQSRTGLGEEAAHLRGINVALAPQTEPIKERVRILETTHEPACPTCGQPLTEEHRRQLLADLTREIEERRQTYRVNQERIKEIEDRMVIADRELADLNLQLQNRSALDKRLAELEAALAHADDAAAAAKALTRKIERWSDEAETDRSQRAEVEGKAAESERRLSAASLTQADVDRVRLEKRLADERVGGARQKLEALDAFAQQRQTLSKEKDRLTTDSGLLDDLREAFSKRGIPAMIIETVVPELERSANELLARMTDGRMHVRIETQRETKSGDLREALEIIISDELGDRPYELYSGGEAFRINFAIRIALSRLLARRAGAQLRSLYIDEGFGTQDVRGRENLISAINSIQDDFDRILVITHIDELKDAFPARIEVTKTSSGSRFSLS
jgi:exonuclease SbcC